MHLTANGKALPIRELVRHQTKLLRVMKLTSFLLLVTLLQVSASSYEQTVSLNQKNADLGSVFKTITKQTGYTFLYNDKVLAKAKKIDIDVRDMRLEDALVLCFTGQPLEYSILNKTVVIRARAVRTAENMDTPPLQVQAIKGKVVDSAGNPVGGVTVSIKGTKKGVATDANGEFSLDAADADAVLVFSSIGYATQEVHVRGRNFISIRMAAAAENIGDMVVTALGVKRERRSVGYSIASIKGDEITKSGVTMNPFLSLYGKASGVGVNTGAAGPMGGLKINIRGSFSLNPDQNIRPLFVVDGVIINDRATTMGGSVGAGYDYGSNINDINSEDIESIDILKGAKATVLYGTDAANGVVLITTKSGKNAKGFGMTGALQYTVESPKSYLDLQKEYGLGGSIYDTAYSTIGGQKVRMIPNERFSFGPKFDGATVMAYDSSMVKNLPHNSYADMFQTGHSYNANVAISGSNEKGNLRASYTNYKYNDIISPNSYQLRNTFSFNGNIKASKLASFELVSNIYNIVSQNRREQNGGSVAWGFPVDYDYHQLYNNWFLDGTGYQRDLSNAISNTAAVNIGQYMWALDRNRQKDDKFHIINSAKATLQFTPHLSLVGQFGLDYDNTTYTTEMSVTRIVPQVSGGDFRIIKENNTIQTYQGLLNYDNDFHDKDIHFSAFGGFVYRLRDNESLMTGTTGGLNFPGWYSLNNMAGIPSAGNLNEIRGYTRGNDVLYSVLGSATVSWRNELFLEFQAREDWNSTLPPENNKYFYPGASVTWNYTDRFSIPGMNRGQVRFAWADVGNGTNQYFANNQYSLGYISGTGVQAVSVTPDGRILPGALGPERKREFELGINNSFFKGNRLSFDMDFYTFNRYGQIINLPVSTASSSSALLINAADVKQWGFEFSVTGTPVLTKDFRWDITVNGSTMGSKVRGLYPGVTQFTWKGLINGAATSVRADVGHPVGEIKTFDFTRDDQGNQVVNNSGVYTLDSDPNKMITKGNIMPKVYGGVLSDFHYKNFNFRIGLDYKYGGTIFSYTNQRLTGIGQLASTLQYRDQQHGGLAYYVDATGTKIQTTHDASAPAQSVDGHVYHDGVILPGTKLDASSNKYVKNDIITSATAYYETYANDLATSFPPDRLYRNDYIKLREASISYTLNPALAHRMHFQAMTITAAGRNLFYLYKSIPNIDAEAALGADGYVENTVFPGQRTYSLGLNFAF
jgi:iron complex outermembrane receptor protein